MLSKIEDQIVHFTSLQRSFFDIYEFMLFPYFDWFKVKNT